MTEADPYHEGERSVQERARERERALLNAAVVGEAIPSRAIAFLAAQRMLVIGSVDDGGLVRASMLFGARGFTTSPDGRSLVIDRSRVHPCPGDPVWGSLRVDADVGLLAIELESRRRLRINGVVRGLDQERIEVIVRQAYPNCPKYIQRRHFRDAPGARSADPWPVSGVSLDQVRARALARADTFFVASRHPGRGLDVSHRGGAPGFIRVLDPRHIRVPDYPGNSMFNTLGNFAVDDRAGLVVPDFEHGRVLQMTGTAAVRFDAEEDPRQPTGGTGRYWDLHIAGWLELPIGPDLAWELLDHSPHNPSPQE